MNAAGRQTARFPAFVCRSGFSARAPEGRPIHNVVPDENCLRVLWQP